MIKEIIRWGRRGEEMPGQGNSWHQVMAILPGTFNTGTFPMAGAGAEWEEGGPVMS